MCLPIDFVGSEVRVSCESGFKVHEKLHAICPLFRKSDAAHKRNDDFLIYRFPGIRYIRKSSFRLCAATHFLKSGHIA